jgi:Sperm antigen HE2
MKTARFFVVMMSAAVLLPGTSLARQADHSSRQAPSQSGDKSGSDYQRDVEVRDENGQTRSGEADQVSKRSANLAKTTTKRPSSTIHSEPAVSHPRRLNKTGGPAMSGARVDTPGIVTGPQRTNLKTAVPIRNQAVSHRSLSAPSSAVAVNGQQFKNSHDPGAHLTISGGPLTALKGTAAINGTNMKRRP